MFSPFWWFQCTRGFECAGSEKQLSSTLRSNEQRSLFLKSGILFNILFPSFWISMSDLSSCFYVMLLLLHVLAECNLKFPLAPHCLKWAGKPRILSPLMCARYGWISVGCDMLKCCSCQAFLCASLQPTLDFEKCEWNLKQLHNNNTRGQTGCLFFFGKVRLILSGCQKIFF